MLSTSTYHPKKWSDIALSGSFSNAHNFDATEAAAVATPLPGHAKILDDGFTGLEILALGHTDNNSGCYASYNICPTTNGCPTIQVCPSTTDCPPR